MPATRHPQRIPIMKTFAFRLALLASLAVAPRAASAAEVHPWNEAVPFEQATIHYTLEGTNRGEQVLYLRARGDERAREARTSNPELPDGAHRHSIEITTPRDLVRVELLTRSALEMPNHLAYLVEGWKKLPDDEREIVRRAAATIDHRFPATLGRREGVSKGTFLGYDCDLVTIAGVTTWYIEGTTIPLKAEGTTGSHRTLTVATRIDTETPVPDEKFRVPEGVAVRLASEAVREVARGEAARQIETLRSATP